MVQTISEKILHTKIKDNLITYCPSMNLCAVGAIDQNVHIFRANGQRVASLNQRVRAANLDVESITWNPDGNLLAIAWSDGAVRLVSTEGSKKVHQFQVAVEGAGRVTCLAWSPNNVSKKSFTKLICDVKESHGFGKLSEPQNEDLDLPRDLAAIDIESSLPKLSPLPSGSTTDDIFSSQTSLDAMFCSGESKKSPTVDVLLAGTAGGKLHLTIFSSFIVGSFPSPVPSSRTQAYYLAHHSSHQNHSVHGLLFKSSSKLVPGLAFVPMDLRFLSASAEHLSLLASKSTMLSNLLRYVSQTITLLSAEYDSSRDLPSKFLRNINETLAERTGSWSIVPALYHQIVTGHTLPEVKEWLIDELAERGHKRWDKAVSTALDGMRRLLHEHMLPALERIALIVSRLYGLALYNTPPGSSRAEPCSLGFNVKQIKDLLDTTAAMTLLCNYMLTLVVDEIDLFSSFSTWLRLEIDRLGAGDSVRDSDEMEAKDAMINHSTVLRYIQHSLTTSRFAVFFNEIGTSEDPWGTFRKGESIFETIDHHLRQFVDESSEGSQTPRKTSLLLPIAGLFMHLDTQSTTVFSQIAEAEKRNVIFGSPITIQTPMADSPVAMTTISMDASQRGLSHNYIAFLEKEGTLRIVQIKLQTENGVSTYIGGKVAGGLIEGKVMDLAFLDSSLVCLVHEKNAATGAIGPVIMMGSVVDCGVELPAGVTKEPAGVKIHEGEHAWRGVLLELLRDQISWLPEHMKIVPADGTSAAKILLSGENGTKYKVLQMN